MICLLRKNYERKKNKKELKIRKGVIKSKIRESEREAAGDARSIAPMDSNTYFLFSKATKCSRSLVSTGSHWQSVDQLLYTTDGLKYPKIESFNGDQDEWRGIAERSVFPTLFFSLAAVNTKFGLVDEMPRCDIAMILTQVKSQFSSDPFPGNQINYHFTLHLFINTHVYVSISLFIYT